MDKAASVFLRADIQPDDVSHLIRWLRNRNVTRYLNEDALLRSSWSACCAPLPRRC